MGRQNLNSKLRVRDMKKKQRCFTNKVVRDMSDYMH